MPKRVYQLARELDVKSKILVDKLNNLLNIQVKNHMSLLQDDEIDRVLVLFGVKDEQQISAPEENKQNEEEEKHKKSEPEETGETKQKTSTKKSAKDTQKKVDKDTQEGKEQDYKQEKGQKQVKEQKQETTKQKNEQPNKVQKSPEDLKKNLDIKMDEEDEKLIEKYIEDETETKSVEKIGEKPKKTKNKKTDKKKKKSKQKQQKTGDKPSKITIPESITVKELAEKIGLSPSDLIKKLLDLDVVATINKEIDYDTASLIATEFDIEVELESVVTDEEKLINDYPDDPKDLQVRPPIAVVMGHVDHGKTSLLDAIRETNVIGDEAGGITQHIGAYCVHIEGRKITFLDTPGHEAFTSMRARGAQATDIAILVVAADDGIMPQTIEAIDHAKAAGVNIIVAINKVDKPEANIERVKQELAQHNLLVEDWGGDTVAVPVSAKNRENIDQLLEMVLLTSDILELKANPDRPAKGVVVESKIDKGRGPVATILVQNGTLHVGDTIIAGTEYGRIRAMIDDTGKRVKKAKPSTPIEVLGLSGVTKAGEIFHSVEDERLAKQVAEKRRIKEREATIETSSKVSLDQLFDQIKQGEVKELKIIVKADVQGSAEAVKQSLEKLSNEEVKVKVIHIGVGAVNDSDVMLASASNAIIIGFNVRPETSATDTAKREDVDIRLYRVIYNATEDVEAAMKGLLDPKYEEQILGHAEVRELFKFSAVGTIAGCYVTDGKIYKNSQVRLIRDGVVVFEGKLSTLKRYKDDVKEVFPGYECGLTLEKFNDIKDGDIIECFTMQEVER